MGDLINDYLGCVSTVTCVLLPVTISCVICETLRKPDFSYVSITTAIIANVMIVDIVNTSLWLSKNSFVLEIAFGFFFL